MHTDLNTALRGPHVELVPLELGFADELTAAANEDRSTYGFTEVPDGVDEMRAYITRFLGQRDAGIAVPFATRHLASGDLVGCTRFLELRRWFGRSEPDEVEIGGTWLKRSAQRSSVNTEAKLLMLTQAFDAWGARRVALCTDELNHQSRDAIERIGASFEGILRRHRPSKIPGEDGQLRNTAMFAITAEEWPGVKQRLDERCAARSGSTTPQE